MSAQEQHIAGVDKSVRQPEKSDRFDVLLDKVSEYLDPDEMRTITDAYEFAKKSHNGQFRKSGEPYIMHPVEVAIILSELHMDVDTLCAALLHDTVEDTDVTLDDLTKRFNATVAELVDGVTKINKIEVESLSEAQVRTLRKMLVAMSRDIRVIVVKLADRLHNMRTLMALKEDRRIFKARETMEIYAPLANRLGMSSIKWELEDLSFFYLEPAKYQQVQKMVSETREAREKYLAQAMDALRAELDEVGLQDAKISGRPKHLYSIYQKMSKKDKDFSEIYDLIGLRIIVDTIPQCYSSLGAVHNLWHPIPGRFKDYIAMPKPNGYQSLHTTLIGKTGQPFEIQIRTFEMHREAEYGIAAHWKYKVASDGKHIDTSEQEKLTWLRQILEWQQSMSDNKEFMKLLKSDLDLFSDSVYCFTPNGEVKNLPAGSTPIDFAYAIHSAVGNKMVGARVNGKLVNIDYKIQNGDRVEIITSQNSKGPSLDWLNICKSASAKSKINQWFKKDQKEENIIRGKELFAAYLKTKGLNPADLVRPEYEAVVLQKYGFRDWDAVMAAIGHGGLKEGQVVNKLQELYEKDHAAHLTDEEILAQVAENAGHVHPGKGSPITVRGIHDVAVHFAHCCNPVPGDEIVGFVTRGRGITIHRTDCYNVMALPESDRARLIDAEWESGNEDAAFEAEISIYASDRAGLLSDVSKVFTEQNISIISINTRTNKQGFATMSVSFHVSGREELNEIVSRLRQIRNVIDITRTNG